jgi:hypothetical protein
LTSKYPFWSPYSFSGNQVIHSVELEGLETQVDLNYNEGTVTINKEGNRLVVTQADLNLINTYAGKPVTTYLRNSTTNFVNKDGSVANGAYDNGGYINVTCTDCLNNYGKGVEVWIKLPTEKAIQTKIEKVGRRVIDKPGKSAVDEKPGHYEDVDKDFSIKPTVLYTSTVGLPNVAAKKLKADLNKSVNDKLNTERETPEDEIKVKSVVITFKDKAASEAALSQQTVNPDAFKFRGVDATIKLNTAQSSVMTMSIEAVRVTKVYVEGTPAQPAVAPTYKTVYENKEVKTTKPPVNVKY